ncbi:threonine synthase-like 2 [Triplophysa dalaica]|uniref:threonine synthase-like 2 n=1 Tax=Triplophysa dalaica TaxID=1582913 RepID=UPI0024DF494E|nr:threonine synthase-like 2 [Triplophysa dalaica]XP_056602140.1 threonine synthase-like 2 [Triplophysa dalaica]XP_056602141.1 threonine synthase-like 2 [Triplophysa dalaica]
MRYCSTRGGAHGRAFRDVLFSGYAPDGGMFMPETIPTLSPDTLRSWRHLSYQQLMCEICSLFIPEHEIPKQHLQELISEALSKFSIPETVRIVSLRDSLSILELFHGETLSFKDLAMSCTGQFLKYFLHKEKKRATILVGTSGDTGSSAIRSVFGVSDVDIVVVFPRGRITAVQERQMTASIADNVHVFAADGTSDDIDVPLRKVFADSDLVKRHGLMSLNSVNWSRILLQLPHFLFAYLQLSALQPNADADDTLPVLEVLVPTGGAGNITAGCIMKMMGVPLRLVAMVNTNDIVHRTVQSGDFSMASDVVQTLAPAIDIQDPYNLERIFWLLSAGDAPMVQSLMEEFQKTHRLSLPVTLHRQVSEVLSSGSVTDEGILHTMTRCFQENDYLICPHTAVAVCHHYDCPVTAGLNRCCIATASPAKFQEAVHRAGLTLNLPEALLALETLETRYEVLEKSEDWESKLRRHIELIASVRQRGQMFYTSEAKE